MSNDPRLLTDRNIWLATVRPDGRPHLVPIWFCFLRGLFYVCTESKSVKAHNLASNPRVSLALEDGTKPLIAQGLATIVQAPFPADVLEAFKAKYAWDITTDASYNTLIEIAPQRWLKW